MTASGYELEYIRHDNDTELGREVIGSMLPAESIAG